MNEVRGLINRAAIDFGSGALKMVVTSFDPNTQKLVGLPLLSCYEILLMTEDVAANDGNISAAMSQKALRFLQEFKREASRFAPIEFAGIATGIFRQAKNGKALLKEFHDVLGIPFQMVSQEQEGELGFLTAKALFPQASEGQLVVWDLGNGSMQLTFKEHSSLKVCGGQLGHGLLRIILSKEIRKGQIMAAGESGNPISKDEATQLSTILRHLLPEIPYSLKTKIDFDIAMVVAYGGKESAFARVANILHILRLGTPLVGETIISLSEIQQFLDEYLGADDEIFHRLGVNPKTMTNALLLHTVMDHFKIENVHYSQALGNTLGMSLTKSFWPSSASKNFLG